ncbi:hypothetical protein H5410_061286 [Solanum commersonii]|uniref:Uncharacterized protein n=1 Tax=Solanum commersonii TaxID=4109 RepID=A0A9J5W8P4_SOLCO|nr:hypothetical protein H5410_061286 [Solanum commersonii]
MRQPLGLQFGSLVTVIWLEGIEAGYKELPMNFRCRNPWMAYLEALCCRGDLTGGFTRGLRSGSIHPTAAYLPSYNGVEIHMPPYHFIYGLREKAHKGRGQAPGPARDRAVTFPPTDEVAREGDEGEDEQI